RAIANAIVNLQTLQRRPERGLIFVGSGKSWNNRVFERIEDVGALCGQTVVAIPIVHTQVGHLEAAIAIIDVAFDDIAERAATAGFDWQWPTTRSEEISGWDKLACLIGRFFQTQNVACRTRPTPGHEVDVTIPAAIAPPSARARWKGRRIVHR